MGSLLGAGRDGAGLDREAVRRRAEAARRDHRDIKIGAVPVAALVPTLCADVFALLAALEAAEAQRDELRRHMLSESASVPRSALVQVGSYDREASLHSRFLDYNHDWAEPLYVLRTEGGAS